MRTLFVAAAAFLFAWVFSACNSSSGGATFCDTCLKAPLEFTGDHALKPYVRIGAKDCQVDTIKWSYAAFGPERRSALKDMLGMPIAINKEQFSCVFQDTSYAWLVFSDCNTGRGIQVHLPLSPSGKLNIRRSGINNFDPKFSIANGLIAYSDRGNIFVEELATGRKAMMTFGKAVDIDYDVIHETLDSVNITPNRIWVKVKIGDEWKELKKDIELK